MTPSLGPGLFPTRALTRALRLDLGEARYTVAGVTAYLGEVAAAALAREELLPTRQRIAGDSSALATLVRLFVLGQSVPRADIDVAFAHLGADSAVGLGLLTWDNEAQRSLRASCDLRPYAVDEQDLWITSDHTDTVTRAPLAPDHVLGVGGASVTLASWVPRTKVRRALDLGTGCGVQALHLRDHADEVVATDISLRALEFARFNTALAGAVVDVRAGDMFAPVAGERFELIVSNPPYVITPRGEDVPAYEHRDGGRRGDDLVADLVRGLPEHLQPGGIAVFLANWEVSADCPNWRDRWTTWLADTGLDAWVVSRDVVDPAQYAETWVGESGLVSGSEEFDRQYAVWLADFAARGVQAIHFGVVIVRAHDAQDAAREPWRDLREESGALGSSALGEMVAAGVRARTWLARRSDEQVLARAWRVAPDVAVLTYTRPATTEVTAITLTQGGGLRRRVPLDTLGAALISVCDGGLSADQALVAIASLLEVGVDQAREQGAALVRDVVADGLLLPADGDLEDDLTPR